MSIKNINQWEGSTLADKRWYALEQLAMTEMLIADPDTFNRYSEQAEVINKNPRLFDASDCHHGVPAFFASSVSVRILGLFVRFFVCCSKF